MKTEKIIFAITPELKDKFKEICDKNWRGMSSVITEMITKYVEEYELKKEQLESKIDNYYK
jgi:hypothetical protein